jgi:phosphate transport system substrate-binding protein
VRNAAIAALLVLAACSADSGTGGDSAVASRSGSVALTGAGATFPYPLYSKWFSDYDKAKHVRINYQSIGSGGGIRQLSEQTVDFGASDSPMSDEELAKAKGGPILHVPTVIGAVAVIYNLPEVSGQLRLDGATLGDIFLGRIKRWNDGRIAALNPGVTLPASDILVVHRSDGSGTTYIFTDYLAAVSAGWRSGPGRGKEVQWPVGIGAKGNEGVAGQVKQMPGAIGYAELAYAKQNDLGTVAVRNAAGEYVAPTVESATAAAAGVAAALPPTTDYRVSIVNAQGAGAYPIASFTWILLYRNQPDSAKGSQLMDFLRWALTEGDDQAAALDYAPLPEAMSRLLVQRLEGVTLGAAR